jgi:hypothetical protein
VKNLFGLQNVYLKAFMTRLTPVVRTQLFLKVTFSDKNRCTAFDSSMNKESGFVFWEMHEGVVTLIHFLLLPTDDCWESNVANL